MAKKAAAPAKTEKNENRKRSAPDTGAKDKKNVKKQQVVEPVVEESEVSDFEDEVQGDDDMDLAMFEGDEGDFSMYFGDEDEDDMMFAASDGEDEDVDDENMDLDELISIEAPAKKSDKKKKDKKKAKKASEDEDEDDDDDEEINVNFEFFDPDAERDYHTIRSFIRNLIDDKEFDCSNLADIISGQAVVGTVVKADDAGNEPLGFVTCLDYEEHKDAPAIKQFKQFVLNNAGSEKNKKVLEGVFKQGLGLLMHDRIMNLPMEIVPVLYNELSKDIEYARGLVKGKWKFDNYLLIGKCCDVTGGAGRKGKGGEVWYTKFEEEFFHQEATLVRKFPSKTAIPWTGVGKLPASHMVMVIPAAGLDNVRDKLVQVIGINGEEY